MAQGRNGPALSVLLTLSIFLAGDLQVVHAQTGVKPGMDQQEVERRLTLLQQSIASLKERLEQSRADHQTEQSQLRKLDLIIQATAIEQRELDQQATQHLQELDQLEQLRDGQISALHERQAQLANQIEATYRLASQSRVKLVLNQDNPAQLSRMMAYYNHINRAQIERINALKTLLSELEQTYRLIDQELARVHAVQKERQLVVDQQQAQHSERENLLVTLQAKIDNEEAQLAEFERNREDLEILLEKLSDVLADIPSELGQHLGVAAQKGQLPMPVTGRVLHSYGQQRAAGMRWQGWLLEAATGAEVRNVAYGRVAFADWLRGYGLMMIIDHGQGFMSLYGYNESLLWEVGDWVESGVVIATVGGNLSGEQGLYFELRKAGKAIDPAAWIDR